MEDLYLVAMGIINSLYKQLLHPVEIMHFAVLGAVHYDSQLQLWRTFTQELCPETRGDRQGEVKGCIPRSHCSSQEATSPGGQTAAL